jgi:hypothetical protein
MAKAIDKALPPLPIHAPAPLTQRKMLIQNLPAAAQRRRIEELQRRIETMEEEREEREGHLTSLKQKNRALRDEISRQNRTIEKVATALDTIFQEYLSTGPSSDSGRLHSDISDIIQIYSRFSDSEYRYTSLAALVLYHNLLIFLQSSIVVSNSHG